jgi:hypothetical protein
MKLELRSLLFANTQKRSRSLSLLCDILWRSQFVVAFGSDGMAENDTGRLEEADS